MTIVNKGFRGRHTEAARQLPPGQHQTADFPVLQAGPTPRIDLDDWRFTIRNERRRPTRLDVGPTAGPAPPAAHCRHSLRHHLVQTGYQMGRRFARHAFRISRHHRRIRTDRVLRRLHHQHPGSRSSRRQGLDRLCLPGRTATRSARRPGAAAGAALVFLEVREVGAIHRVAQQRHSRILGGFGLSQLRRPVARTTLRRGLTRGRWFDTEATVAGCACGGL